MAKDFSDITVSVVLKANHGKTIHPNSGLSLLMQKVREAFRGVEFVVYSSGSKAWVYYPNEP